MNSKEIPTQSAGKQNTEYFIQLVRTAMADDIVSKQETELLKRLGEMLGFSDAKIKNLIETTSKTDYIPPVDLSTRFNQVHGIVKMTMADGTIDKNEMRLASSFAIKSGFDENEIPKLLLLLIDGIKQDKDENELFEVYIKGQKRSIRI